MINLVTRRLSVLLNCIIRPGKTLARLKAHFIKVTLLFTIALGLTQAAKAQFSDYVVTTKGDTIKCAINKGQTKYKPVGSKHSEYLDFDEVISYYSADSGKIYHMMVLPYENDEHTVYAEVVLTGKINLYRIYVDQSTSAPIGPSAGPFQFSISTGDKKKPVLYVFKTPGHIESIKTEVFGRLAVTKRNKALDNMLSDNPASHARFTSSDKWDLDSLLELIREYNKTTP